MPIALLPFSRHRDPDLLAAHRRLGRPQASAGVRCGVRGWGLLLLVIGVLIVQVAATVQTARVVREGLQDRLESNVYLFALVAGTGLSILVGLAVTILVAGAPRAGALLGLTIGAIGMASWTSALIDPTRIGDGPLATMLVIVPWIAPVLTGIAIAWTGVDTVARVIAGTARHRARLGRARRDDGSRQCARQPGAHPFVRGCDRLRRRGVPDGPAHS